MDAEERLANNGYEDVVYLTDYSYDSALIGVTHDDRAVYDYDLMVEWLMEKEGISKAEAVDWIEYNTIRSLGAYGDGTPVILFRFID